MDFGDIVCDRDAEKVIAVKNHLTESISVAMTVWFYSVTTLSPLSLSLPQVANANVRLSNLATGDPYSNQYILEPQHYCEVKVALNTPVLGPCHQ